MDRRTFIVALAGILLAATRDKADAQQAPRMWRIGILANSPITDPAVVRIFEAFFMTLGDRGYIEGKNLVVDRRSADGRDERFPALAAELVGLEPDVIVVAGSGPATMAVKALTSTIPIVMAGVGDPVGRGLVASLAHPGGNITGISNLQLDLISKRVELLKSAIPQIARVVLVSNPAGIEPVHLAAIRKEQDAAMKSLGVILVRIELNTPSDWPSVAQTIVRDRPDALALAPTVINFNLRREIAEFANAQRLPTIGFNRDQAVAGFLMSYGSEADDLYRHVAVYVDKILKGAKPADLPVEQPTKFELVINMKTAKAVGVTIPPSLLLRADTVIQ
jgi:putative tryptophan/tyrosine transport system substrate-binding protein